MAKTFRQAHHDLQVSAMAKINSLVHTKGKKSEFRYAKALKVKPGVAFNLDGGRYLKEVIWNELIDNEGHAYSFTVLTTEQLCKLADSL